MTRQDLNGFNVHPRLNQPGDVGMPQGVEVDHAIGGFPGDSGGVKIPADQLRGGFGLEWKQAPLPGWSMGQPPPQVIRQSPGDRLANPSVVLGDGGVQGDGGRIFIEVERTNREGGQFARPESASHRHHVERRPILSTEAPDRSPSPRGLHEAVRFLHRERPANPPPIHGLV